MQVKRGERGGEGKKGGEKWKERKGKRGEHFNSNHAS
jgi:hypothetical protein